MTYAVILSGFGGYMRLKSELKLMPIIMVITASFVDINYAYADQKNSTSIKEENKKISILLNQRKYDQAISIIKKELKHKDTWAEFNMALLYKNGLGVQRSSKKAFYWFRVAARNGDHYAARYVANAYLQGEGVHRSSKQAAHWFRVGIAPHQWADSYCGLANTYSHGFFTHNQEKAALYYHKCISTMGMLIKHDSGPSSEILGPLKFSLG
jgi:TPR repeat protein